MTNATITETEQIKLGARGFAAAQQLAQARKAKTEAEKLIKEATAVLEQIVGTDPNTVATYRGVPVVKVQQGQNSKIDREALLIGWPEAHQSTLVVTPYTFFKAV